MFGIYF